MNRSVFALTTFFAALLAACASRQPPEIPPALTAPPVIEEGFHATYQTTRVFNAPLTPLRNWIDAEQRIVGAMEETAQIKKPVDAVVLSGEWPEAGSARRLEFSDGHYVFERVLVNDFPHLFRYQVWGYTSSAGDNLAYAIGEQRWRVTDEGQSALTWTYRLRPKSRLRAPFIRFFVRNDMRPLMDNALDKVKAEADETFSVGEDAPAGDEL